MTPKKVSKKEDREEGEMVNLIKYVLVFHWP